MAHLQVTCINKTPRFDPHDRIRNLGGAGWVYTQPDVISYIERRVHTFFVHAGGVSVDVIVATHNGHKYVKTRNDGIQPDNLLSLPECR